MKMNLYRVKLPEWQEWDYAAAKNHAEAIEQVSNYYKDGTLDFNKASIEYVNEVFV